MNEIVENGRDGRMMRSGIDRGDDSMIEMFRTENLGMGSLGGCEFRVHVGKGRKG